jgi:hypothetical protein
MTGGVAHLLRKEAARLEKDLSHWEKRRREGVMKVPPEVQIDRLYGVHSRRTRLSRSCR